MPAIPGAGRPRGSKSRKPTPPFVRALGDQRFRAWATLDDAADYFGLSSKSLRRLIAQGKIPAYRIGPRLLRVDLFEADKALKSLNDSAAQALPAVGS